MEGVPRVALGAALNPSSGNLHPTEGYAVLPECPGLAAGVYHYASRDHRLEQRARRGPAAGTFLIGLSSIHWREAWKYGERAWRYCQHDAGHAVAAVRYAAATLGWSALVLDAPADADAAALLGLDDRESFAGVSPLDRDQPNALLLVGPSPLAEVPLNLRGVRGLGWVGKANPLSPDHVRWDAIDAVAEATRKPTTEPSLVPPFPPLPPLPSLRPVPASTLLRQRRSCLALDGKTLLDAATLFTMLDHLLPRPGVPPWDALPWRPRLHLGLFVHRVRGLERGLYLFERDAAAHDALRAACRRSFSGGRRPAAHTLRLFLLAGGDYREAARRVSCHQEIASDGAFAAGMVAEFGDVIRAPAAWCYRRLFWEAGVLGQALYLGAEAAGVRGTGIGCYFDDLFHDLLGLGGDRFQSLYHFTIGTPLEDTRLRTLAPYAHLAAGRR